MEFLATILFVSIFLIIYLSPTLLVIYLIGFMRFLYFYAISSSIYVSFMFLFDPVLGEPGLRFFLIIFLFLGFTLPLIVFGELFYRLIFKKWFFKDKEYKSYFYTETKTSYNYYRVFWNFSLFNWIIFPIGIFSYLEIIEKLPITFIGLIIFTYLPLFIHRYISGFWFKNAKIKP